MGEVEICRILANKVFIGDIFHRKEKGPFYGVFRFLPGGRKGKRSLYRAYFHGDEFRGDLGDAIPQYSR